MSEPTKVDPSYIKSLTADQINQYLQRKDCERPCEACGHSDWLLDAWKGHIVFLSSNLPYITEAFMITLPLTCSFCGNMRQLNATRVARDIKDWEAEHGQE